MHRIAQLSSHVASRATSAVIDEQATLAEPPALSDSMLADYILNGFHVCTVDELPSEFHR